ncbi:MAG TPA: HD domain-containing protein [Candidatus Methylomirabilis sp.]|nr:HD domain-containing protein [Candidatus Methylomirabilis sp.]
MTTEQRLRSLPEIIRNVDNLYEGDLIHYFRIVFFQAKNLNNPYHNFRHLTHITWLCYQACLFYEKELSAWQMRNLLMAALFHDYGHSGVFGRDDLNIAIAITSLKKCVLAKDRHSLPEIFYLIRASEYPRPIPPEKLELGAQILCDADLSQVLSKAWLQQNIFGLAKESGKSPLEMIKRQIFFLKKMKFATAWAQQTFPPEMIREKVRETEALLQILSDQN